MDDNLILDVQGEPIDPIWAAEFRGFFWGEGCLGAGIVHDMYRIAAIINLRMDDADTLREFQRRLGGTLSLTHNISQRHTRLNVSSLPDCQRVARLLAGGSNIPFAKKRQLVLWQEMLDIKQAAGGRPGSRYTEAQHDRMWSLVDQIQSMRRWSE